MRGDVRHVERGEHCFRRCRVIIGRAADEAEPGKRDDRVDRRAAIGHEEGLDRGARIEPARKCRDHPQAARLHRRDRPVIMPGIAPEQVRAQHQYADRALGAMRGGQCIELIGHAARHRRMIDADLGIFVRRFGAVGAAQLAALAIGIAIDQRTDHPDDIVFAARQPILQRQQIGADILRGARDEAQHLGQPAQHLHLPRARRRARLARSAQPLEHRQRPLGGLVHPVVAELGQLDDFAARHQPDHRVAILAARHQRGEDRGDMILEEQHRRDDDVAAGDVVAAALRRAGVIAEIGGGVERDPDPRSLRIEACLRTFRGARKMVVERDDDHVDCRGDATVHNEPSRRKGCPV